MDISFNEEKNLLLKEIRGVCFDDVIDAIKRGNILDNLEHHDLKKYPNQKILVLKISDYIYVVPYVIDEKRNTIFLKTVYPSRVLYRKYFKKEK